MPANKLVDSDDPGDDVEKVDSAASDTATRSRG